MNFYRRRFNLYLQLAAALALAAGCATDKKTDKLVSTMRVHIECGANVGESGATISLLRSMPVQVTISTRPILTEANLIAATLMDAPGGFAIKVRFDEISSGILEQYTAGNPGRHLVIAGEWGKTNIIERWLAAPLITHRIADGMLTFTPDASRAEATEFVQGLNNDAKANIKDKMK